MTRDVVLSIYSFPCPSSSFSSGQNCSGAWCETAYIECQCTYCMQKATLALNAVRRFRYTLDLKSNEIVSEKDELKNGELISRFRTVTHALRVRPVFLGTVKLIYLSFMMPADDYASSQPYSASPMREIGLWLGDVVRITAGSGSFLSCRLKFEASQHMTYNSMTARNSVEN